MRSCFHLILAALSLIVAPVCHGESATFVQPRVIELTADHDSRYRHSGKIAPTIEATAGEALILHITAVRAKQVGRDGSVHGLALLDNRSDAVPGWKFYLHPGVQEISVTAPAKTGRYTAVCTVICSDAHEGMEFTLVVIEPVKGR